MENILFLSSTESDGSLGKAALETLAAAIELSAQLQGGLTIGLFGATAQPAADAIATCGATRIIAVEGEDFATARYASDAAAAEALGRAAAATIVLAPETSRMARVMAGVARRLQGAIDTHVTGWAVADGKVTASRTFYRQRIEATLLRAHRPWILVMDPGSRPAWNGASGCTSVEKIEVAVTEKARRTVVEGTITPPADQQTIRPDAKLLFVTGAGWTKKQQDGQTHLAEAETAILDFLKHTKASLGSSKSLVDLSGEGHAVLGFMTHLNQVGQTGATPRHPKGLSTCCHGEEPHVVGWRFISERRAVNLDPNCGWARGKADVLYVADAFEVMKKVNALLTESSDQKGAVELVAK
jgi:electron transfer flavoprotein alpha subunit